MKVVKNDPKEVILHLTGDETSVICNALNESLEHLDDEEYETRMGATKDEVKALLACLHDVPAQRHDGNHGN